MTPLCTTAMRPEASRCGWELRSEGAPCVAQRAGGGIGLEQTGDALVKFADLFADGQRGIAADGHARAVVAAVFESAQAFQQDGPGCFFAHVSDEAAHNS